MREKPILFSAPMVLGLLARRKTQTRRLVTGAALVWLDSGLTPEFTAKELSPYREVDQLWVRENFARVPASAYRMSEGVQQTIDPNDPDTAAIYAAGWDRSIPKWKPCIHMPRWACRITLPFVGSRIERLNECSETDAIAEGVVWSDRWQGFVVPGVEHPNRDFPVLSRATGREMYAALWDTINGSGAWLGNPWVWVHTFKEPS
jgi:hypothetical protein